MEYSAPGLLFDRSCPSFGFYRLCTRYLEVCRGRSLLLQRHFGFKLQD